MSLWDDPASFTFISTCRGGLSFYLHPINDVGSFFFFLSVRVWFTAATDVHSYQPLPWKHKLLQFDFFILWCGNSAHNK